MTWIINVRRPHGGDTCIARARGFKATASSTNNRETAVDRLVEKIAGDKPHTLKRVTTETYLLDVTEAAHV